MPLTNLLKNSVVIYEWERACDKAFETLKGIFGEGIGVEISQL